MPDVLVLTPPLLDQLRQAVHSDNHERVAGVHPVGFTLGASLECACWWADRQLPDSLQGWRQNWPRRQPVLSEALALLQHGRAASNPPPTFSAPQHELWRVAERRDLLDDEWNLYLDRFRRSLIDIGGFGRSKAGAVSQALCEMADNLIQHSGMDACTPSEGLVGYHVTSQQFSFSVVDLGRGVLPSLRENPQWADLPDATAALQAAVSRCATRRPDRQFGDGFRQLHEWLADLNGSLRFRSGDGVFAVVGQGDSRRGRGGFTAPLTGLQVTVTCGRDQPPRDVAV